jgi:hypothetical protein
MCSEKLFAPAHLSPGSSLLKNPSGAALRETANSFLCSVLYDWPRPGSPRNGRATLSYQAARFAAELPGPTRPEICATLPRYKTNQLTQTIYSLWVAIVTKRIKPANLFRSMVCANDHHRGGTLFLREWFQDAFPQGLSWLGMPPRAIQAVGNITPRNLIGESPLYNTPPHGRHGS